MNLFKMLFFTWKYSYSTIKGKVFHGQESPSGESTTTVCAVNYQLLTVMLLHEIAQLGTLVAVDHIQLRSMVDPNGRSN